MNRRYSPTILIAIVWVVGCTSAPEPLPPPPHVPLYLPRVLAGGLLAGELTRDGQCLFLERENGTTYGIAWPAGRTTWDEATGRLVIGEMSAAVGDHVELGAAIVDLRATPDQDFVVPPRPECVGDEFILAEGLTTVGD